MAKKKLNIGLMGCGFMGRTHSNAYNKVNKFFDLEYQPVLKAACARPEDKDKLEPFAENWGWQSTETDWQKMVERDDLDVIDIVSPNNTHHDIAMAAAKAGKIVLSEKPLAMNAAEALEMAEAVEKAGVANMVWFNYRRVPAITLAKQLIDEGLLGRIFHYRAKYLQDWTISPDVPQGGQTLWRLDAAVAGSGVTGDLLAHSIDTAVWLIGGMDSVTAMTETFIKERAMQDAPGTRKAVTIDDACAFLARFNNGALATFESTRYARGRKNQNTFEINGEHGSIAFDLEDAHLLQYFNHREDSKVHGWRNILVTDSDHPYMDHWWVPGLRHRLRAHLYQRARRFPRGARQRHAQVPDLPRRPRNAIHLRRRPRFRQDRPVDQGPGISALARKKRPSPALTGDRGSGRVTRSCARWGRRSVAAEKAAAKIWRRRSAAPTARVIFACGRRPRWRIAMKSRTVFGLGCLAGGILAPVLLFCLTLGAVILFKDQIAAMRAKQLAPPSAAAWPEAGYAWSVQDLEGQSRSDGHLPGPCAFPAFLEPGLPAVPARAAGRGRALRGGARRRPRFYLRGIGRCRRDCGDRREVWPRGPALPPGRGRAPPKSSLRPVTPRTYLVAPGGSILLRQIGSAQWDAPAIAALLHATPALCPAVTPPSPITRKILECGGRAERNKGDCPRELITRRSAGMDCA